MKWRVYIATTEGPVEIQRIAEEDPEVRSVVCLNGTSEALPISNAYDAFVRRPTGIIEKLYGHPAFRMDVSGTISEGRSWQLGALVAHALYTNGQLAVRNEATDQVMWLTGEVDTDLHIHPVNHVHEKLVRSSTLFQDLETREIPLTLVTAKQQDGMQEVTAVGKHLSLEHADDLLREIGVDTQNTESMPEHQIHNEQA